MVQRCGYEWSTPARASWIRTTTPTSPSSSWPAPTPRHWRGRVDLDGDQAWVDEPWLRALGGYDVPGRREPYLRMLDFARDRGWRDAAGRIAAHVVHTVPNVHNGQ